MVIDEDERDKKTPSALGGMARSEALSPDKRRSIARKAARARWAKVEGLPSATHEGEMKIGDIRLACSVLDDPEQTRVLTEMKFMESMGMYRSGALSTRRTEDEESGARIPLYLAHKNLKPYILKHLSDVHLEPFRYLTLSGNVAHGIRGEIIPRICEVWLDARADQVLGPSQQRVAAKAELLTRGFAHVGIIALIDEATGFQSVRARRALEQILEAYISKRLVGWAKRFPDEFYEQMFRLKGWDYRSLGIAKRPGVVGKYTNDIVYARLAPGVLEELQRVNAPNESGRRSRKHHHWLTTDVGHPALRDHLAGAIALMKASRTWDEFKRALQRAFPLCNEQMLLDIVSEA